MSPCRDDGRSCDYSDYHRKIDNLTQMLCYLCGEIKRTKKTSIYFSPAIKKWWEDHQESDMKRVTESIENIYKKQKNRGPKEVVIKLIEEAEKVHYVSKYHKVWFFELAVKIDKEMAMKEKKKQEKAKIRKTVISKLSKEEKKALGLE